MWIYNFKWTAHLQSCKKRFLYKSLEYKTVRKKKRENYIDCYGNDWFNWCGAD